ncbi:hypothetical protein F7725_021094 [Dissostichus mawsoni]|uniref:G-protein coupled receptors family 1 profile domain-containing protein n=1 Tax=Dissostichus mawsoni TaxID=36200 RepID=A0A7J5YF17_DISMA|nr:hypothetical protein F7725_021094 [Dissostichus mawsoni]
MVTLRSQTEICLELFGISQNSLPGRVAFTNRYYGGDEPHTHRVLYVNGGVDPWKELSVGNRTDGGEEAESVFIRDSAHCADMTRGRVTDRRSLKNARQEIEKHVESWLKTAQQEKKRTDNSILCASLFSQNLHEPMYIFIAALLIKSVLYSTNIYPKLLIDFLSEKQIISYQACLFQTVIYITLSYSEFLLLAAMAYDRYVSICKPLQYSTIMRKRTVIVCLVLSWLLPTCRIQEKSLTDLFTPPVVLISFSCFFTFDVIIVRLGFNIPVTTRLILTLQHKNLHEPMYFFIAALLLNSIVYNTAMYPKLLETGHIIFSLSSSILLYYTLSASDFFLLSAMAYDRYVSICKPLQYHTIMRTTTVSVILSLAWLVPACQVAVSVILVMNTKFCHFTLKSIFCNNSIYNLFCISSKALALYDVYALFSMALLPLLFILFTYTRILIISYRSGRNVRRKAAQTCLPHLVVLFCFSCLCAYDVIIIQLGSDLHSIMTLQAFLYYPLFNPVIYGLKVPVGSCWFLFVPDGLCWFLMLPVGSCWFLFVPDGLCWFLMLPAPDGSCRFLLVPVGSCWFLLVPDGSCRFLLVPVPVGSCWFLLVPVGSCWFLLVPDDQTCEDASCPFSGMVTLRSQTEICLELFGISQNSLPGRVAFTNRYYGGDEPHTHRVLYVNGGVDPWKELSVGNRTDGGEEAESVFIRDSAHCADMTRGRVTDCRSLKNARQEIEKHVESWLKTAQQEKKRTDAAQTLVSRLEALQCHFTWDLDLSRSLLLRYRDDLLDIGTENGNKWLGHIYNLRGFIEYKLGSNEDAQSFFNKATEAFSQIKTQMKDPAESEAYLSKVDALNKKYPSPSQEELHPEIYAEKAYMLMTFKGDMNLVADYFQRAIEMQPDMVEWNSWHVLALTYAYKRSSTGLEDDIFKKMRIAQEQDPENLNLAAHYLWQRAKRGESIEDEARFEKSCRQLQWFKTIAMGYRKFIYDNEDIDLAEEALKNHPDERYLKRRAALCYKKRLLCSNSPTTTSMLDRAVSLHQEVIALYPDSPLMRKYTLPIYALSHDGQAKAERIYQELLKSDLELEDKQCFTTTMQNIYISKNRMAACQYDITWRQQTYSTNPSFVRAASKFWRRLGTEAGTECCCQTLVSRLEALQCHFTWDLDLSRSLLLRCRDKLLDIGNENGNNGWVTSTTCEGSFSTSWDPMKTPKVFKKATEAFSQIKNTDEGPWLVVNYGNLAWLRHHLGDQAESEAYLSKVNALNKKYPSPSQEELHQRSTLKKPIR